MWSKIFVSHFRSVVDLREIWSWLKRIFGEPRNISVPKPNGVGRSANDIQMEFNNELTNTLEVLAVDTGMICKRPVWKNVQSFALAVVLRIIIDRRAVNLANREILRRVIMPSPITVLRQT